METWLLEWVTFNGKRYRKASVKTLCYVDTV